MSPGAPNAAHPRNVLVETGCALMIAAAGGFAAYSGWSRPEQFESTPNWAAWWSSLYLLFIAAYTMALRERRTGRRTATRSWLGCQALAALALIWLFPSFLITSLLVVVAWHIAWEFPLRAAIVISALMAAVLVVMKCADQTNGMSLLILLSSCAFQLFAVAAAHLAQSELTARMQLTQALAELQAAHILLSASERMAERLRISRDLHDALGHNLTIMALQLDVASRMASGGAAKHVEAAREAARQLLEEVRTVVGQLRIESPNLQVTLRQLANGVEGMNIELHIPDDLPSLDAPRADALLRCVQELITNTLRHGGATRLDIRLEHCSNGSLLVTASDNGVGGRHDEGNGLRGMRERFEELGGYLTALGNDTGFAVRGVLPSMGCHA